MGFVVPPPFSGAGLLLPPAPVSIKEMLRKMLLGFDDVVPATVALPAYNVVWTCLCCVIEDDLFDSILSHVLDVL